MNLAEGDRVGRYIIEALLGSGGNGVVYRARDVALDRLVALKLLHADDVDRAGEARRMLREARAAAALDHRNICPIHEVGEHDGRPFIAMQYVAGETLQARMERGPVPLEEARRYALQIADALAAAHAQGIVHRDLKPSNLLLAEGRIKLADFGLARSARPSSAEIGSNADLTTLTETGVVVGTPGYMSLEQMLGGRVDARGDVFSFGVVLYEMLSGKRAFARHSQQEAVTAVLENDLPPLRSLVPGVPAELDRIVARCLETSPSARYASGGEVLEALRRWPSSTQPTPVIDAAQSSTMPKARSRRRLAWLGAALALAAVAAGGVLWPTFMPPADQTVAMPVPTTVPNPPTPAAAPLASIAVLPFANLSPEPDSEYFADGVAEELLNILAGIDGLKVASRTSAFSFKGKDTAVPEIARQLGVRHVLEGSVRRQGSRVRIRAQLIQAEGDARLWSKIYDRELTDIFRVQEEIAQAIAVELEGTLGTHRVTVVDATADLDAYRRFLDGRTRFHRREQLPEAIADLEYAVARDPGFAEAWVYLAAARYVVPGYVDTASVEAYYPLAEAAAERAAVLSPQHPMLLAVQGDLAWARRDPVAGKRLLQAAARGAQRDTTPLLWLGVALLGAGQVDASIDALQRAVDADPLSAVNVGWLGIALACAGREAEAEARVREAVTRGWRPAGWVWTIDLALRGERERAAASLAAFGEPREASDARPDRVNAFLRALRDPGAIEAYRTLREPDTLPEDLLALGDAEAFLDWLLDQSANAEVAQIWWLRSVWLPANARLREDPRLFAVAERMGLVALWEAEGYPAGCSAVEASAGRRLECALRGRSTALR
jgi:serine/threonine-protein kinase